MAESETPQSSKQELAKSTLGNTEKKECEEIVMKEPSTFHNRVQIVANAELISWEKFDFLNFHFFKTKQLLIQFFMYHYACVIK